MSQRKEMLMKNMEFVAYEGLNGKPGFQMTLHKSKEDRYYLLLLVLDIMVLILLM